MSELAVPKHIAEERAKAKAQEVTNVDSAFVEPDNRVLDPSLLDKSLLERLPSPTGWRLLVLPYQGRACLLYTSPSPRDKRQSRMPSSA